MTKDPKVEKALSFSHQEVKKFDTLAPHWWDLKGPMKPLHLMNPARLQFIREGLKAQFADSQGEIPFASLRLLDVGCGGGILAEPLARLGMTVTGLDASEEALKVAREHQALSDLTISYCHGTIESFPQADFDVLCALEIIEHVENPTAFLGACLNRLKPGGVLFLSTLDRTWGSFIKAIVMAEYILRWVPQGTHTWDKFLRPAQVGAMLRQQNARVITLKGLCYNPFQQVWSLTDTPQTNYILMAIKTP